ncbi:MAG: type III-B CRISPR-associated protein Cas10/Cmr2 [Verrucomicrobiae bacterium]|nr:type III-B CRISPR-associated protein Cas10/Cmr2 [Verrucomicrobiae bacterium]
MNAEFWKRKLAAYLHDPPHKPVGIQNHERQRESFLNRFGLTAKDMAEFERSADWQAAAADRLIFPDPAKSGLRVDWKGSWLEFCHPLGGERLHPERFAPSAAQLETEITHALEAVALTDREDWRCKFIAGWRLWPELAAREQNPHHAYLVADTRIPDHTLWHHNALAAAFTGCGGQPAFLLFQIGPVQDFIAQARKTQDLWSGSYLLSFLIAQGMLAIADEIGPDAIVFPQLRGLPLADFHWWKKGLLGNLKLRASHANELLTPNLPNRFLALVPAPRARQMAHLAEQTIRNCWEKIAASVHDFIENQINGQCPGWDWHWHDQVKRFPVVDWVVHAWSDTSTALKLAAGGTPPLHSGWQAHPLHHAEIWATEFIPADHRESFGPYSNSAFAWALHYALTDWKFAAAKNARSFAQWHSGGPLNADGIPKDHLDGRNEVLGGGEHEKFWSILRQRCPRQFKGSQLYGAISVIKRLWPETYLPDVLDLDRAKPVFEPVNAVAQVDAAVEGGDEEAEIYYAVLAMDGDDMGQWVSGEKAAPLVNSLAREAQDYFRKHWKQDATGVAADQVKRPLSPGYHAALSEALSNFSLYCAAPIVRAFGGQLIYAGGDDVLAMLPARTALDCAQGLQLAFRGVNPAAPEARASAEVKKVLHDLFDYDRHVDGFLTLRKTARADVGRAAHLKPNWPLMVMGPQATASVGIAIGHVRSPMQDTIQAARDAEQAAKKIPGKGAFCLNVLKRSGEAVGFAAQWQTGVVSVWGELEAGIHDLSGRFAYRYASLVKALVVTGGSHSGARYAEHWNETLREAVTAELAHVFHQQGGMKMLKARELAARWTSALIAALSPRDYLHFWLTWAFIARLTKPSITSEDQ